MFEGERCELGASIKHIALDGSHRGRDDEGVDGQIVEHVVREHLHLFAESDSHFLAEIVLIFVVLVGKESLGPVVGGDGGSITIGHHKCAVEVDGGQR